MSNIFMPRMTFVVLRVKSRDQAIAVAHVSVCNYLNQVSFENIIHKYSLF